MLCSNLSNGLRMRGSREFQRISTETHSPNKLGVLMPKVPGVRGATVSSHAVGNGLYSKSLPDNES